MHPNVQQHPVIKQPRSGVTWRPLLRGGGGDASLLYGGVITVIGAVMVMKRTCVVTCFCRVSAGTGILSSLPEENPHWWNANMV